MRIECPRELAEACAFAEKADMARELAVADSAGATDRSKLGIGARSLLRCLGTLARWEADYMEDEDAARRYRSETEVIRQDGTRTVIGHSPSVSSLPGLEVVVYEDCAQYSFFFRETYVDRETGQPVHVITHPRFCFDPKGLKSPPEAVRESVDALSYDELAYKALNGECELVWTKEEADERERRGCVVRHVEREQTGMCGGVIYHPDYVGGKTVGYGKWSIHT